MKRVRRKKVNTYEGISEFCMAGSPPSSFMRTISYIYILAYNILGNDSWRRQRQSGAIFHISTDGVKLEIPHYRSERLHIDTKFGNLCIDGVDEI